MSQKASSFFRLHFCINQKLEKPAVAYLICKSLRNRILPSQMMFIFTKGKNI